jgi:hypothetical protein
MTDAELLARLRGRSQFCKDRGEVKSPDLMDEAADHIEEIGAQLKMVLEREAETQVRHEAREDAIREAALREAYEVVYKWWFDDGNALPQELILSLIGETK